MKYKTHTLWIHCSSPNSRETVYPDDLYPLALMSSLGYPLHVGLFPGIAYPTPGFHYCISPYSVHCQVQLYHLPASVVSECNWTISIGCTAYTLVDWHVHVL